MNQLEKWTDDGVISLQISETAMQEVRAGGNFDRNQKTVGMIYSMTFARTPDELKTLRDIAEIIFPNVQLDQNQKRDVEIVFNAKKYGFYLVTNDGASKSQPGGILGNRHKLKQQLGVNIVTDEEAVELVRKKIALRDARILEMSKKTGQQVPTWLGKD